MKCFIFKQKILLILLFTLIIFLININNVFASDIPQDVLDKNDMLGYNSNNLIFQSNTNSSCYLILYAKVSSSYTDDQLSALNNGSWYYTKSGSNLGFITPMWLSSYYATTTDNGSTWTEQNVTVNAFFSNTSYTLVWSKNNVYYTGVEGIEEGTVYFEPPVEEEYVFPYIANTDESLANIDNEEKLLVFPGDITKEQLPMKFSITDNTNQALIYEIELNVDSTFYVYIVENPDDYWFEILTSDFKNSLVNGNEYLYNIYAANDVNEFNITRSVTYQGTTYVPPTEEEEQTNAIINQTEKIEEQTNVILNQTEKIEEQTEVNKNIFERIGDILSYINPLSENFFAYKLIDLLIDALKSLFIPEERFSRYIF